MARHSPMWMRERNEKKRIEKNEWKNRRKINWKKKQRNRGKFSKIFPGANLRLCSVHQNEKIKDETRTKKGSKAPLIRVSNATNHSTCTIWNVSLYHWYFATSNKTVLFIQSLFLILSNIYIKLILKNLNFSSAACAHVYKLNMFRKSRPFA